MNRLKTTVAMLVILTAHQAMAGDYNTIEFDLNGKNITPTVVQDGSYNTGKITARVVGEKPGKTELTINQKGFKNAATIDTSANASASTPAGAPPVIGVLIEQEGESNVANITTQTTPTLYGGGTNSFTQKGDRNRIDLTTGSNAGVGVSATQLGQDNVIETTGSKGLYNHQSGGYSTLQQFGMGNQIQIENAGNTSISQSGIKNTAIGKNAGYRADAVVVTQEGRGNYAKFDTVTSYGAVSINQSGERNSTTTQSSASNANITLSQDGVANSITNTDKGTFGLLISQAGDRNSVTNNTNGGWGSTMRQKGEANSITNTSYGTAGAHFVQNGKSNYIASSDGALPGATGIVFNGSGILQEGDSNAAVRRVAGSINIAGRRNPNVGTVNIQQQGNSNSATQNIAGNENSAAIVQVGDNNVATQMLEGDKNAVDIEQNGSGNTATHSIIGSNNASNITQTGTGHTGTIGIVGDLNTINLSQSGVGQTFAINQVGSGINLSVVQK